MGLKETFGAAAGTAFAAVGNIAESANYYARSSATYNVSAGTVTSQDSVYMVSGIFSNYKAKQVDGIKILNTDLQLFMPQSELPLEPTLHDYVERIEAGCSVRYEVLDYQQDAAKATWKVQLRKP